MFNLQDRVDVLIRIVFGALILTGCFLVIQPFMTAILLSAILSVVTWPLYERAYVSFGHNKTVAAGLMVGVIVVTVLIPLSVTCWVLAQQVPPAVMAVTDWVDKGMPLPQWILGLPFAQEMLTDSFSFGLDPKALTSFVQKAADPVSKWILSFSLGVGNGLFQIALVAFISFFFYRDGKALARRVKALMGRLSGDLAKEYVAILVNTTRSVVFGVLGTAIGQGVVAGIGFWIAGVPAVALFSFLVCILSLVPVGPPLVWGPIALWLYATGHPGMAVFLVVWGVAAVSSVDTFAKPLLIARGTTLPLALVFLGVFGGIIAFGFLGIVLGPILLSASIAMFRAWVANPLGGGDEKPAEDPFGDRAEADAEAVEARRIEEQTRGF